MQNGRDVTKLGRIIAYHRERRNLSLQELADMSSISASYLNRIELGYRNNVSINYLKRICKALNIDISEVLELEDIQNDIRVLPSLGKLLTYNEFEILGKPATNEEKEMIIGIYDSIIDSSFYGSEKYKDILEIVNLIEEFKEKIA